MLPNEIKNNELTTTSVRRGLVHRELFNTSHAAEKKSSLGASQSDLHFQVVMADKFNDYSSSEEKVDGFELIYMQLPVIMNDVQRYQFSQMLTEEKQHPNQYVFYHGTISFIGFIYDVITEFRKQLEFQYADDFQYLRAFDDAFTLKDVHELVTDYSHDRYGNFGEVGLAVNPFLFGSDGYSSEASYCYFLTNHSQNYPHQEELFNYFVNRLKLNVDYSAFKSIFEQYIAASRGVFYQIFIDESVVDQVATPSGPNGFINPLNTKEGRIIKFSEVIAKLRTDPKKHEKYIKTLQARLYLDPKIFHDPNKVQIKSYRANPLSDNEYRVYKHALSEAVSGCLIPSLTNYQALPPTAFIKGTPGLYKQMGMIYQDHGLAAPKTDVKIKIQQLIAKNNVSELIDLIINTEDLDLSDGCDYGKAVPHDLLYSFKGDVAVQVYNALQAYKENPHIPKILAQLQEEVWYQYVRVGNFERVSELLPAVLQKDPKYLDQCELRFIKRNPYYLLGEGLDIAAKQNQVVIFKFLFKKCQDFNHNPSLDKHASTLAIQLGYREENQNKEAVEQTEKLGKTNPLDLALENAANNGDYRMLEQILDHMPKEELNESHFFNILHRRIIYDDINTLEIILEKIKIVSANELKKLFNGIILFKLIKKGYDTLLKKILDEHSWLPPLLGRIISDDFKSLLIVAIENHHSHIVNLLLAYSSDKNKFICDSSIYKNGLILATKQNDLSIVEMLLEYMNDFDERDQYGKTALAVAAELGYTEIVDAFLSHPKIKNNQNYFSCKTSPEGLDALSLAAKRGHIEVVRLLLNHPVEFSILETFDFKMALLQAVKCKHTEAYHLIAEFLSTKSGADDQLKNVLLDHYQKVTNKVYSEEAISTSALQLSSKWSN